MTDAPRRMESRATRLATGAGLALPVLLVVSVTVLGFLEPGYSHRMQPMSILGGVPGVRGVTFNSVIVLGGGLIVLFNLGLRRLRPPGRLSTTAFVLIWLGAIGMLGAGVFHCDEGCANAFQAPTLVGRVHILTALLAGMGLGLAPLFMVAPMRRDPRWRPLAKTTLVLGVLANLPGITMWITLATVRVPEWEGLLQRLGIIFSLIWIALVAAHLRAPSRHLRKAQVDDHKNDHHSALTPDRPRRTCDRRSHATRRGEPGPSRPLLR